MFSNAENLGANAEFSNLNAENSRQNTQISNENSINSRTNAKFSNLNSQISNKNAEFSSENATNSTQNSNENPTNSHQSPQAKQNAPKSQTYTKHFPAHNCELKVDFKNQRLIYPANTNADLSAPNGIIIHNDFTCNFSDNENFVVFECVCRLLEKGYKPQHIELEPKWNLGHSPKSGRADILVRDQQKEPYLFIECKTTDAKNSEFNKEWARMQNDGGQLFSYLQQERSVKFLCLYTSDFHAQSEPKNASENSPKFTAKNAAQNASQTKEFTNQLSKNGAQNESQANPSQNEPQSTQKFTAQAQNSSENSPKFTAKNAQGANSAQKELIYQNFIITTTDNAEHLKDKATTGYAHATNNVELFEVWKEVYENDYSTIGIFEKNTNAYDIGKNALCFDDLNELSSTKDDGKSHEDGKYHEFAKILRKYNISGKENAFDKLVNLFLCKIYDETHHKDNLHFCFRGVTNDSFEAMQDRLMSLYRNAMREFLNEEITYVSDEQIREQFSDFRRNKIKTKALQEQMQEFIRMLKFYTHSDFSFIEVHNKELFLQNGKVLRAVVKLFESLKLTQNKTTQLLGNLFELFLQKGMKQDEGQFFTPMPICEFIVHSLPLETMLEKGAPKVIDFACGAGHFLNTYASVITPHAKDKNEILSNIYGIEKEYRLSKVSKVSAAMYAQEKINIIYADALDSLNFQHADFDLLISNPPYSVKGFLETLNKDSLNTYELNGKHLKKDSFNAIECFFIERANQLLAAGAKVAIILPSSVLNKTGSYEKAREILLRNFELISIVELGSATFGATGTNTIILFLNKKPTYEGSKDSQSYLNLKENIAESLSFDNLYLALWLQRYCEFMGYGQDDYKAFLQGQLNENLGAKFSEYKNAFENSQLANLLESKAYKESEDKESLRQKAFLKYALEIEKDKLLYFALCAENEVLFIKSPSELKEQKKFLGYEWSNKKGNEGLKELNTPYKSPLFERENPNNPLKLNSLIKNAFNNTSNAIPPELDSYAFKARLVDMIDFSRADFGKAISLNPQSKRQEIKSKFDIVKLESVGEFFMGGTPSKKQPSYWGGDIKWLTIGDYQANQIITDTKDKITQIGLENSSAKIIPAGAVVVSIYATIGRVGILGADMATNQAIVSIIPNKDFDNKYLMYAIDFYKFQLFDDVITTSQKNINLGILQNMKIPKPPREIQLKIVTECEQIDKKASAIERAAQSCREFINAILVKCAVANAQEVADFADFFAALETSLATLCHSEGATATEESTNAQSANFSLLQAQNAENSAKLNTLDLSALKTLIRALPTPPPQGWERVKLERLLLKIDTGITVPKNEFLQSGKYPIISQESDSIINGWTNLQNPIQDLPVVVFGDHSCSFKFVYFPFFRGADGTQILKFSDEIHAKFAFYALQNVEIYNREKYERHFKYLKQAQIPLPKITAQESIIKAVEWLENTIFALNGAANNLAPQKAQILQKYLF